MRGFCVVVASLVAAAGVYAIPNLMELSLLSSRINPWLSCVLFADVAGCGILFLLGFRRLALTIYIASSLIEACLLMTHKVPLHFLVWITNAIPAVVVGGILLKAGLRTLVAED